MWEYLVITWETSYDTDPFLFFWLDSKASSMMHYNNTGTAFMCQRVISSMHGLGFDRDAVAMLCEFECVNLYYLGVWINIL